MCACYLWSQYLGKAVLALESHKTVSSHTRSMDDTVNSPILVAKFIQGLLHSGLVSYIDSIIFYLRSLLLQFQ
ncbi:hypothetical protein D1872_232880 [compost metagenome]